MSALTRNLVLVSFLCSAATGAAEPARSWRPRSVIADVATWVQDRSETRAELSALPPREVPGGSVRRWSQSCHGYPVAAGGVVAVSTPAAVVVSVRAKLVDCDALPRAPVPLDGLRERLVHSLGQPVRLQAEPAWRWVAGAWHLSATAFAGEQPAPRALVVDVGTAMVLAARPAWLRLNRANVYQASPATSALAEVTLADLDGSGLLRSSLFDVEDDLLGHVQADANGDFLFAETQPELASPNAYHHLTRVAQYYAALGFTQAWQPIAVHVHHLYFGEPLANAYFNADGPILAFGDAGVDRALDGDIAYHEYGHAVGFGLGQYGLLPEVDASGLDLVPVAMTEGLADYFACSLSGDPYLGEYSGSAYAEGTPVRDLTTAPVCPQGLTAEPHNDGLIFASALWAVREAIGAAATDRLVYAAMASMTPSDDYPDVLAALRVAAELEGPQAAEALEGVIGARQLEACRRRPELCPGAIMDFHYPLYGEPAPGVEPAPLQHAVRYHGRRLELTVSFEQTLGVESAHATLYWRRGRPVESDTRGVEADGELDLGDPAAVNFFTEPWTLALPLDGGEPPAEGVEYFTIIFDDVDLSGDPQLSGWESVSGTLRLHDPGAPFEELAIATGAAPVAGVAPAVTPCHRPNWSDTQVAFDVPVGTEHLVIDLESEAPAQLQLLLGQWRPVARTRQLAPFTWRAGELGSTRFATSGHEGPLPLRAGRYYIAVANHGTQDTAFSLRVCTSRQVDGCVEPPPEPPVVELPEPPVGCGCASAEPGGGAAAFAVLVWLRRRRRVGSCS